ncbi:hypothetical protein B0H16DRAFT_1539655 [Mycena metata]|uniref:MYND-type domain-containing protein n=1 Tax=Mycena metata TaxID=1033252 RepID=A0AAD7NEF8_9AGAR|nr:hypothetical protein B0H16DRAFT_1539655 [Mycena metata]
MHPAFRLENLEDLSPSLQRQANMCLTSNLAKHWSTGKMIVVSSTNVDPLLPVWYANLSHIVPTQDAIEASQAAGEPIFAVLGAELAVRMLSKLRYGPPGVYPKLWARAWPWIELLHTYRQHLNGLTQKRALYAAFVATLANFRAFNSDQPVEATPGVRVVVGAAWELALDGNDDAALRNVSYLIHWDFESDLKKSRQRRIKEYMEGAGGGIEHFASMLPRHLDRSIIDRTTPMSETGLRYHALKQPGSLNAFRAAFLRHGIVESLVAGMCSLTCTMPDHSNGVGVLALAANLVGELIFVPPGLAWVSDALRAGFLPVFLRAAHTRSEGYDDVLKILRRAFEHRLTLFSAYTAYRSILILMPKILAEVADFVKSEAFMNSQVFAPDRLTLLREFDSTPSILYKACDNLECNKVHVKSELQRCSLCLDLYYCSKTCQITDWRAGHRNICRDMCDLRALPEEQQLTLQDRAFLRTFRNRSGAPCLSNTVLFDYMEGHVSVAVAPWSRDYSEITHLLHRSLVRLHDHGVRSRESRGLMDVHIVAIPRGANTHWKVFPMRHVRTEIVHGLWGIMRKVAGMPSTDPAFESTVADELRPILDMEPQFIYE